MFESFGEIKSIIRAIEAQGVRYINDEGSIPHERQGEIKTKITELQDILEELKMKHDPDLVEYFGKPIYKELKEMIEYLESRF